MNRNKRQLHTAAGNFWNAKGLSGRQRPGRGEVRGLLLVLLAALMGIAAALVFRHYDLKAEEAQTAQVNPLDAVGFLSGSRKSMQSVSITEDDYTDYWDVYLPGKIEEGVRLFCDDAFSIRIDGRVYHNGELLPVSKVGEPVQASVINAYGATQEGAFRFYEADGLPAVYIVTLAEDGEEQIESEKGEKETTQVVTASADGTVDCNAPGGIKVHGNTSWFEDKKSYNLNLAEHVSLLGMAAQRNWVLIGNTGDRSQIENAIVQTLAADLGEQYCPEWRFVNVWLNGEYKGLYTLFQKIAVDKGSVKIRDLEAENKRMKDGVDPDDITGGYLLELVGEKNWETADTRIESKHRWMKVKSPQNATENELTYISDLVERAEEALYDSSVAGSDWSDYYDRDSWVVQYLLEEISSNCDAELGSQFFYVNAGDPKLYGGPAWDFDRSAWIPTDNEGTTYVIRHLHVAGLHDDSKVQPAAEEATLDENRLWLQQLDSYPAFHKRLKEVYLSTAEAALKNIVDNEVPVWRAQIQASVLADSIRWNGEYGDYQSILDAQDRVAEIFSGRAQFLHDYYSREEDYAIVRFRVDYARYDLLVPVLRGGSIDEDVMPLINDSQEWHTADGQAFTADTIVTGNLTVYSSGDPKAYEEEGSGSGGSGSE